MFLKQPTVLVYRKVKEESRMKKAMIIGGSNGIGLAIALELSQSCENVIVVDRVAPSIALPSNCSFCKANLLSGDFSFLSDYEDINTLVITAGFGRVAAFDSITPAEITNSFKVNTIAAFQIIHHYFERMLHPEPFFCAVMGSIAGLVSSPLFALYGATKAALCNGIESLNIELEQSGTSNRILNVSPGSIKGTRFNGGENVLEMLSPLAKQIIEEMQERHTRYIPDYEPIFRGVIERYQADAHQYGLDSYKYKMDGGRLSTRPQVKVGYLSGTFDLFHIGHLNLLRRAKEYCDYLVVGIHKDASHKGKQAFIPFEERADIVRNIKYVDEVILSEPEDSDVYTKGIVKYDYLFVGSDYKGTERFNRYEAYFADKGVEIVYFPYTGETSSTQLRDYLDNAK